MYHNTGIKNTVASSIGFQIIKSISTESLLSKKQGNKLCRSVLSSKEIFYSKISIFKIISDFSQPNPGDSQVEVTNPGYSGTLDSEISENSEQQNPNRSATRQEMRDRIKKTRIKFLV